MLATWYIGAIAVGGLLGLAAGLIFRKIVPAGTNGRYWNSVGSAIQALLFGDDSEFWHSYKLVIVSTIKYVARQIIAVVAAFSPLVLIVFVFGPLIWSYWDDDARFVVFPEGSGQLLTLADDATPVAIPAAIPSRVLKLADGREIPVPSRAGSYAVCPRPGVKCLAFQGIGFNTIIAASPDSGNGDTIIVRSTHEDWNPFWPYLNDPEFLLFLSLSLTSVVLILRKGGVAESDAATHGIGGIDFALTQLATNSSSVMYKVGQFESRRNARKLAPIRIEKPVFISGLARSGTTILLEKLATIEGVATHRYRDFPFVMSPIYWNRFLSIFGSRQEPIERPHKDAIKITRDSPDAFEEPIWHHFFGRPSAPLSIRPVMRPENDSDFRQFYKQHIQKILLIRQGTRYVSKGNYNLLRIKYLLDLFPDARFLVPIRHPITHIESLVRQHEIFCRYAEKEPKVAQYLRAVGHFEFGPQRLPICLDEAGAKATLAHWSVGEELEGYAQQWSDVYRSVLDFIEANPSLARQIRIVHFETLCSAPLAEMTSILRFIDLGSDDSPMTLAQNLHSPSNPPTFNAARHAKAWDIVAIVARMHGYDR